MISDPRYAGTPAERVVKAVRAALPGPGRPGAVFIADSTTPHQRFRTHQAVCHDPARPSAVLLPLAGGS